MNLTANINAKIFDNFRSKNIVASQLEQKLTKETLLVFHRTWAKINLRTNLNDSIKIDMRYVV